MRSLPGSEKRFLQVAEEKSVNPSKPINTRGKLRQKTRSADCKFPEQFKLFKQKKQELFSKAQKYFCFSKQIIGGILKLPADTKHIKPNKHGHFVKINRLRSFFRLPPWHF